MSAFAMFSLKDPSLLAFDQRRRNPQRNFRTICGIGQVPCDTQMRDILDPLDPDDLRPVFGDVFRHLQRGKALEPFVYLDGFTCCRWMAPPISRPPDPLPLVPGEAPERRR